MSTPSNNIPKTNLPNTSHLHHSKSIHPSIQELQSHLLNLWTSSSVDQTYQNLFLVFIQTFQHPKQQIHQIQTQIKKTYQQNSLFFLLQQNLLLRSQIKTQIQHQIYNQTQSGNIKKSSKIDIILRQLCDKLKNLRRINLLISENILKIFQDFKVTRQSNIGSLGRKYIDIFMKIDVENEFIKESFLNEYILFQKGYDPFFLVHYEQTKKSQNVFDMKKHPPVSDLFEMNISYVYRLMRAQQKMLKYMLFIDDHTGTEKERKEIINRQRLLRIANSNTNQLPEERQSEHLPSINNRFLDRNKVYENASVASTIKQFMPVLQQRKPKFLREGIQLNNSDLTEGVKKKIYSLRPLDSHQIHHSLNSNTPKHYSLKSGQRKEDSLIPISNSQTQGKLSLLRNIKSYDTEDQMQNLLMSQRQKQELMGSREQSYNSAANSQRKWNVKKVIKDRRNYMRPVKTQQYNDEIIDEEEEQENQFNHKNKIHYQDDYPAYINLKKSKVPDSEGQEISRSRYRIKRNNSRQGNTDKHTQHRKPKEKIRSNRKQKYQQNDKNKQTQSMSSSSSKSQPSLQNSKPNNKSKPQINKPNNKYKRKMNPHSKQCKEPSSQSQSKQKKNTQKYTKEPSLPSSDQQSRSKTDSKSQSISQSKSKSSIPSNSELNPSLNSSHQNRQNAKQHKKTKQDYKKTNKQLKKKQTQSQEEQPKKKASTPTQQKPKQTFKTNKQSQVSKKQPSQKSNIKPKQTEDKQQYKPQTQLPRATKPQQKKIPQNQQSVPHKQKFQQTSSSDQPSIKPQKTLIPPKTQKLSPPKPVTQQKHSQPQKEGLPAKKQQSQKSASKVQSNPKKESSNKKLESNKEVQLPQKAELAKVVEPPKKTQPSKEVGPLKKAQPSKEVDLTKKLEPQQAQNRPPVKEEQSESESESDSESQQSQEQVPEVKPKQNQISPGSKIRMIPGKISFAQFEAYIKQKKPPQSYSEKLQENIKFVLTSAKNTQTYLNEFHLNDQLANVALCSPTASGNMVIYLWMPIDKICNEKSSQFLFKKYLDYLEQQTTCKALIYSGIEIPELKTEGFVMQKEKNYLRKRVKPITRESFELEYFFSMEASNICFVQNTADSLFFSDEISPLSEMNSWCNPDLLNAKEQSIDEALDDTWEVQQNIKSLKQANAILQNDEYDTFEVGEQKAIFKDINMTRSKISCVPKLGFICSDGFMIVMGKSIVFTDVERKVDKIQMMNDVCLYFGSGFKSLQQMAQFLIKIKGQAKHQDCKFAFKMFSKQVYGRYMVKDPQLEKDNAFYCNWQLNFAWRDEIPGKMVHDMNGVKNKYGPENFVCVVEVKGVLNLGVEVEKDDFLY